MILLRRIVQIVSLLFFLLLLSLTVYPLLLPPELLNTYVQLSPFQAVATWLNTGRFIHAFAISGVLILLTLVFGRFFCGWICPMGITFDATDKALRPKPGDDSRGPVRLKSLKYGLLIVTLAAAYFEANLAGWLDPLSFVTRLYAQVVLPSFEFVAHLIFRGLYPVGGVGPLAERAHSFLKTTIFAPQQQQFHGLAATALIFAGIALLVYINRRFWCRYLCPLGAVLAIFSRFSIFKRVVDTDKCINCNKCVRNCRMGAILDGGTQDYRGECIECFTCKSVCPKSAVSFRPVKRSAAAAKMGVSVSRRGFIASAILGLAVVPFVRISTGLRRRGIIRPPGAGDEDRFMQTCVRCGLCLRACPTNGLQPSWFDNGVEGLWSPELIPRIGYCDYGCTICGSVCPSGAIKQLDEAAKNLTVIGLATVDRNRCIPWTRAENCIVCEEHCPVPEKAIRLQTETVKDENGNDVQVKRPYVVKSECIGCGICESKCPVPGPAAIRVDGVMPQTKKTPAGPTNGFKGLLPDRIGDWKASGAAMTFAQDKLFEFIDGGAEIYYEYGFAQAATRDYEKGDESVTLDVFEMASPESAFGIFSYERDPEGERCAYGDGCTASQGQLVMWQKVYYIKLTYSGESEDKPVLKDFARRISKLAGRESGRPEILSVLPAGADREKVMLVSGPLTARNFYPFGTTDWAGFRNGSRGLIYVCGAATCLTVRFADTKAAAEAPAVLDRIMAEKKFSKKESPDGGVSYKLETEEIQALPRTGGGAETMTLRLNRLAAE